MASLNRVHLIGNLTRDPEVRYTPKGTAVCEIALAVNRNYSGENGEKKEEVTFLDVTVWARQAEIAGQYLQKGRSVYIEGRLQNDNWVDQQSGQKRSRLKIIAENLQFLSGQRAENEAGPSAAAASPAPRRPAAVTPERRQPAPAALTAIPQDSDPFVEDF